MAKGDGKCVGASCFSFEYTTICIDEGRRLVANVIFVGEMTMCTAIVTMN